MQKQEGWGRERGEGGERKEKKGEGEPERAAEKQRVEPGTGPWIPLLLLWMCERQPQC